MNFALLYSPQAKEGLQKIFKAGLKNIAERTFLKISANPHLGKKLAGKLDGLYSIFPLASFQAFKPAHQHNYKIIPTAISIKE